MSHLHYARKAFCCGVLGNLKKKNLLVVFFGKLKIIRIHGIAEVRFVTFYTLISFLQYKITKKGFEILCKRI